MNLLLGSNFSREYLISELIVNNFCHLTADLNPIHLDQDYAKNSLFGKRIVPGMLLSSYIASIIGNDFPGKGTIYLSQNLKFLKPVYLDEKVTIKITVLNIMPNDWLKLETVCFNINDEKVLIGEAIVIPPK